MAHAKNISLSCDECKYDFRNWSELDMNNWFSMNAICPQCGEPIEIS